METICETIDYSSKEMIKTKSFWILFFWGIGVAGAGYILMAHANGILNEAISTVDASLAATIVGLISIANGLGRMIYGFLYDKLGYKKGMLLIEVLLLICIISLGMAMHFNNMILICIGFIAGGLFFAGVAANTPPLISEFYGKKYYTINYSIINLCVLIASMGSTIAGNIYDQYLSYEPVIIFLGVIFALSFLGVVLIKKPIK